MKKQLKKYVFLVLLIILISFSIFSNIGDSSIDFVNFVLFLIIYVISILGIMREIKKKSFSLVLMNWIFIMFFFAIAPIVQISFNFFPWRTDFSETNINFASIMIIIWSLFFYIGTVTSTKKNSKKSQIKILDNSENANCVNKKLFFITVISILCALIIIKNVGITNLFSRKTSSTFYGDTSSLASTLIVGSCTKIFIVFANVISIINFRDTKKGLLYFIINGILLLLTCFPTGMARNTAATIYMGIFVIFFYNNFEKIKNNLKYIFLFIFGFMILFPAINVFRNTDILNVNLKETMFNVIDNVSGNYISEDYDAFAMIINTKKYIELEGVTYGKQLVGNLMFFIPRNLWKEKPVGSGSMIFDYYGYDFKNVSCPLVAEGLINFGILGVIIYAFVFGNVCAKIDNLYWDNICLPNKKYTFLSLIYPFLLPLFFFMLRGDFLSSVSVLFVYILIFGLFSKVVKLNKR